MRSGDETCQDEHNVQKTQTAGSLEEIAVQKMGVSSHLDTLTTVGGRRSIKMPIRQMSSKSGWLPSQRSGYLRRTGVETKLYSSQCS